MAIGLTADDTTPPIDLGINPMKKASGTWKDNFDIMSRASAKLKGAVRLTPVSWIFPVSM
jgi:hypothetical protein